MSFPDSSVGKESACNAGDLGSIPGLERSSGEGIGYPLQYSGLENSMDCSPLDRKEAGMTERLSLHQITREGFPGGAVVKNPPTDAGNLRDLSLIPGSGRSPGGGHGNPLLCSCLENPHGQRSLAGYGVTKAGHACVTKHSTTHRLI